MPIHAKAPWVLEGPITDSTKVLTTFYTIRNEQGPIAYLHTDLFSPEDGAIDRANARLLAAAPRMEVLLAAALINLRNPGVEREIALLLSELHTDRHPKGD